MAANPLQTVPDPVRHGARRAPEAPALMGPAGQVLSYGALDAVVERAAGRLADAGVGEGTRVACLLPRTPVYVALLMALWRREAVAAPLPARAPPAERARLLSAIDAAALVSKDAPPERPEGVRTLRAGKIVGEMTADAEGPPPDDPTHRPVDQPATLVFTSGSTGPPKAALHTAGNHFFSADGSRRNLPLAPADRWLLSLPLYHVGGLAVVLRCLWAGATVAVPRPDDPLAAALRRTGATHASLVAAQLRRLLDTAPSENARNEAAPASMKALLLGGGPVPPALVEAARRAGWPIAVSYGLTEMASQVTTTAPDAPLDALLHTAGRPLAHRRVRVRADGEGDVGEILVHGRTRFAGYVTAGEGGGDLREPFTCAFGEDGWLPTGDLGRFDADGRLRVTGRRDRRFVSGGENIQPEAIEAVLRRCAGVAEAAVVPVPDEVFGQRPVAFVRRSGAPFRPAEDAPPLRAALRDELPGYAVPDTFHPWPADADARMKPDRERLKRRAREQAEGEGG